MENSIENGTILIVDDEKVVLDVATLMIKKLGFKTLQATDGKEATRVFRDNVDTIRLVILDTKLPDESGAEVCKKIKDINPDVRILHTSGIGAESGNAAMDCGCKSCFLKPFQFEKLSHKLKKMLEHKIP